MVKKAHAKTSFVNFKSELTAVALSCAKLVKRQEHAKKTLIQDIAKKEKQLDYSKKQAKQYDFQLETLNKAVAKSRENRQSLLEQRVNKMMMTEIYACTERLRQQKRDVVKQSQALDALRRELEECEEEIEDLTEDLEQANYNVELMVAVLDQASRISDDK